MANPDHVAILLQGVEVWSKWREQHPDIQPDLMKVDLKEAQLEGADLCDVHLEGAFLGRAHLEKADLSGAHLEKAVLIEAHLEGAKLGWARLKGADFNGAHLEGARLLFANFNGARLVSACLEKADLPYANLKGTNLGGANLVGANVSMVRFDRHGRYQCIRLDGCYGSQRFVRHAKDQDFLEELRGWDGDMRPWKWDWRFWEKKWWNRKKFEGMTWRFWLVYLPWLILCDCGRSMLLWAGWSILMACGFAWRFVSLGEGAFRYTKELGWDFWTALYYSVVTFTTLGFGDVTPLTHQAARWVMAEVIAGYLMLGGLISIFANKLARRGG